MIDAALRGYVIRNYQRQAQPNLSALIPKLRAMANGNPTKPDPNLDSHIDVEVKRAAANTKSDDEQANAKVALAFVEAKIAAKEKRRPRHEGDKALDRLVGSLNSAWIEGFEYELPSYTPGRGPYHAFLESLLTSYASRLPDEYADARLSLLTLAAKPTALRKRFRRTGLPRLKMMLRRWVGDE